MALSPGTIIGGYRIEKQIGAGGMGTVYLARHPSLPRKDAIKVLGAQHTSDHEFRTRFEREANVAAGLDHPNIVAVYNRGEEYGRLWIAMQYVPGIDAAAEIARDPHGMHPLRALRIITDVGKGLDYAHRKGLLHRDIKPANFLLTTDDTDEERVLLADFGVAKSADDASELTQAGTFVATIAYASPEQLSGHHLGPRSDIYSLACSFYKLLTGRNPFPSDQPTVAMMGHLQQPPPRATDTRPGLPPAIDDVLAIAMAKNPADRFGTCREFTDAATDALKSGHAPARTNTSPTYPIQVFTPAPPRPEPPTPQVTAPRGRWIAIAAAAVVTIALAIGIGVWASSGDQRTPAAATAALSKDEVRKQHPQFLGKRLTMVDITDNQNAVFLTPSNPTTFLQDLGFTYNPAFTRTGDEPTPRPVAVGNQYAVFGKIQSGYVLAIRSDTGSGSGGLRGLPGALLDSTATVIAIDDPRTVRAIHDWTADSEAVLLEKLVPVLETQVK
ncbi:serine/threonine-protein kinase [Nocardia sp. NPDC005998]|uniref:serine/threonine-protein kinase n=1 Tax=Nocardia sp. NPDC005998 TaxID=3156894 RepID=UPI0033BE913F